MGSTLSQERALDSHGLLVDDQGIQSISLQESQGLYTRLYSCTGCSTVHYIKWLREYTFRSNGAHLRVGRSWKKQLEYHLPSVNQGWYELGSVPVPGKGSLLIPLSFGERQTFSTSPGSGRLSRDMLPEGGQGCVGFTQAQKRLRGKDSSGRRDALYRGLKSGDSEVVHSGTQSRDGLEQLIQSKIVRKDFALCREIWRCWGAAEACEQWGEGFAGEKLSGGG